MRSTQKEQPSILTIVRPSPPTKKFKFAIKIIQLLHQNIIIVVIELSYWPIYTRNITYTNQKRISLQSSNIYENCFQS